MKVLIILAIFLSLPMSAFSKNTSETNQIQLTCVTEFPTTSFDIYQEGDFVYARVLQHNGLGYMPIFSGLITSNDIPSLVKKSERLLKVSDDMTFKWPLKNCTRHDEIRFECFGTKDQLVYNGITIVPFSIHSSKTSHDNIAGKYDEYSLSLSLSVGDGAPLDYIEMKYRSSECFAKNKNFYFKK